MTIRNICVCAIEAPFDRGGAEIQLESLVRELKQRGYNVAKISIPFVWSPLRDLLKNALIWRWLDLTQTTHHPIDLVICSKFPSYAVPHPNKVTWLIHQLRQAYELHGTSHSPFTEATEDEAIRQSIINFDTKILAESKAIFTEAQRVADRLKHYNGLEGKALYHPPQYWEQHYHRQYGGYILSVSRLVPLKRIDLLIRAIALAGNSARAIIVGDGPERANLEQLAESLGVTDRITFTGAKWGQELVDLYADAQAVYYAPLDEDYGLVVPEAFRSHKPALTATDSGGTLEFVLPGETGFVTAPEPQAIADAINQLMTSEQLCTQLGNAGYDSVQFLSWDYVIDNLVGAGSA